MPLPGVLTTSVPLVEPFDVGAYDFQLLRDRENPFVLNESVGITVQLGVQGLDGPTLDIAEDTPAGWDGSMPTQITAEPLEVFLPLLLESDSLMGLRALKQSLTSFVNPRRGPVTLRVGLPDSSGRLIDGYYRPVPGTMDDDSWWVKEQKIGLVLHCTQPFWRSEDDWEVTWKQADDPPALLPLLPLAPADSNALGASNDVTIDGDIETYPVWYITGPLASVEIADVGTGRTFTLTAAIGSGDTWVVDTRRGQQAVYDNLGARQRSTLNPGAQLWPLQPGLSQVETTVTGASAGAQVRGVAQRLWLTP